MLHVPGDELQIVMEGRRGDLQIGAGAAGLALGFAPSLPPPAAAAIAALLALLLGLRFVFWEPQLALRRLDIGIMYLGYLAIVAQLLAEAAARVFEVPWVGSVRVHLFALGTMSLIILAMLVRISKGHTGRKVVFDRAEKLVLHLMMLGFVLRVVSPQMLPSAYVAWIYAAAACWCAGFSVLAWRYIPILSRPRIDGKAH